MQRGLLETGRRVLFFGVAATLAVEGITILSEGETPDCRKSVNHFTYDNNIIVCQKADEVKIYSVNQRTLIETRSGIYQIPQERQNLLILEIRSFDEEGSQLLLLSGGQVVQVIEQAKQASFSMKESGIDDEEREYIDFQFFNEGGYDQSEYRYYYAQQMAQEKQMVYYDYGKLPSSLPKNTRS